MTYEAATPRYSLPFNGKEYDVIGTFELIDAIEWALKDNILSIVTRSLEMPIREMSKLIAVILTHNGHTIDQREVGNILWNDVGIGSDAYVVLALHVHSFLRITVAKPNDREATAKKMGEDMGKVLALLVPSLG